ncbi:MAG: dihydrolipoamide dehydrogenase [Planctomycetota bacterium]|jgi:dihydrolipoamide dehydrogenase
MPNSTQHDLIIIGAGPGGYVAALRAAQLGLKVACVEKEPKLGGTCLRVGCIPSKALLESSELYARACNDLKSHGVVTGKVQLDLETMLARKNGIVDGLTQGVAGLFKKHKITRYLGHGQLGDSGQVVVKSEGGEQVLEAPHVLLATGSVSAPLAGVELDGDRIGTSTEALTWKDVPAHLVVIGAGFIGLELGSVWARLGAEVTVLEYADRILPGIDGEIAEEARGLLSKQGLQFRLKSQVTRARTAGEACIVSVKDAEDLTCDRVLLAVGRLPNAAKLGLQEAGVALDESGRVQVDERFATSAEGIYAIGDLIRGPMLAHKAAEEGVACVERLVNGWGHVNYDAIPGVCYTEPEIAAVGRTEEELRAAKTPYKKGSFPFLANGRAHALGQTQGRVKILAHAETDRLLGVHVIGARAGDLIAEATAAMAFGATAEDLARTCHAHPTLAECLKEAALAVDGLALHI